MAAPKTILVTGAGGAPALNFTRSLRSGPEPIRLIGVDCQKYYLQRAECDEIHLVPRADHPDYMAVLREIIKETGATFVHTQNDIELRKISDFRDELPIKHFLPSQETVRVCMDKFASHERWKKAGIPQPQTMMIKDEKDLAEAFSRFGGEIWIRETVGAAGKGALPAKDLKIAKAWMDFKNGWGKFTAAELLSPQSITWMSIWRDGQLVVAQGRNRLYWEFADRAPSGVTGITGTGVTVSDPGIDELAQKTVLAIDSKPHGIFSVDMTYDKKGVAHPTEINIGRFFTTHEFFTRAGLNMPYIYVKLAYGETVDLPKRVINPLPTDLAWIRGMDCEPILMPMSEINVYEDQLNKRLAKFKK